jgi:hypothetical protein
LDNFYDDNEASDGLCDEEYDTQQKIYSAIN